MMRGAGGRFGFGAFCPSPHFGGRPGGGSLHFWRFSGLRETHPHPGPPPKWGREDSAPSRCIGRNEFLPFLGILAFLVFGPAPAWAELETLEDIRKRATVFIQCETDDGAELRGTGALVSRRGHVLTAKHILDGNDPEDVACMGKIGTATGLLNLELSHEETDDKLDALLFLIRAEEEENAFDNFLRYCAIERRHQLQPLVSIGFPGRTASKQVSVRAGILSTTERTDGSKLLETDILTTPGMSGGPTVFAGNTHLVGIIVQAEGDPLGTIAYYGILPVAEMDNDLTEHMTQASREACAPMRLHRALDRSLARIEKYEAQIAELEARYAALEETQAKLASLQETVDLLAVLAPIRSDIRTVIEKIKKKPSASPDILDTRLLLFERILEWDAKFEGNNLRITYKSLAGNEIPPVDSLEVTTALRLEVTDTGEPTRVFLPKAIGRNHASFPEFGTFDLVGYKSTMTERVREGIDNWADSGVKVSLPERPPTLTLTYTLGGDTQPRTETLEIDTGFLRPLFTGDTPL